jgi:nucleoside-diphosphate-sugar epimerase
MASVLLTGVAGFIGSYVAEKLLAQGWKVRGVDALTDSYDPQTKVRNLRPFAAHPSFSFVHDDLVTADLQPYLEGADTVVHLAAEAGVSRSWGTEFPAYVHRNVLATHRLLEAATQSGVPRFVYASSSSVYGPTSDPMHESSRLAPLSPYGVSKLAGECLVGSYAFERGLSTVALRFFSVYGPRQRPDMVLHRFIEALLDDGEAVIYGETVQHRDFTYVGDVAEAVSLAATAPVVPGTVLNIAHGKPVAVPDLLRMAEEEVGRPLSVSPAPHRPGDTGTTHGDATAAAVVLGWRATTDLRTGVARQVAWHRSLRTAPAGVRPVVPSAVGGER